ncbi:hypothetical protein AABB24_029286 [Solanum stoloniferum]|uniref:Uncharacterized protein n=1 Tax=Solanum stoloniferum TaxID=62892 RepID=A0ABD2RXC2_9SOLN
MVNGEEKAENNLRKWFKDNSINSRSLKHVRNIHRAYVLKLQGKIIENLFCYMIFSTSTVLLIKRYMLMSMLVIFLIRRICFFSFAPIFQACDILSFLLILWSNSEEC